MTEAVRKQLAAHCASPTPKRTSGRGTDERATAAKKSTKKDHSDELTSPQVQAARLQVIRPARLAYTNTTFGVTLYCLKYQVADEAQAAELDALFFHLTGTQP